MDHVTLHKLELMASAELSNPMLELSLNPKHEFGNVVAMLTRTIMADPPHMVILSYPDGWVQALKQRWLPVWAKAIWPVRMKIHTLEARRLYPDLKITLPGERVSYAIWEKK